MDLRSRWCWMGNQPDNRRGLFGQGWPTVLLLLLGCLSSAKGICSYLNDYRHVRPLGLNVSSCSGSCHTPATNVFDEFNSQSEYDCYAPKPTSPHYLGKYWIAVKLIGGKLYHFNEIGGLRETQLFAAKKDPSTAIGVRVDPSYEKHTQLCIYVHEGFYVGHPCEDVAVASCACRFSQWQICNSFPQRVHYGYFPGGSRDKCRHACHARNQRMWVPRSHKEIACLAYHTQKKSRIDNLLWTDLEYHRVQNRLSSPAQASVFNYGNYGDRATLGLDFYREGETLATPCVGIYKRSMIGVDCARPAMCVCKDENPKQLHCSAIKKHHKYGVTFQQCLEHCTSVGMTLPVPRTQAEFYCMLGDYSWSLSSLSGTWLGARVAAHAQVVSLYNVSMRLPNYGHLPDYGDLSTPLHLSKRDIPRSAVHLSAHRYVATTEDSSLTRTCVCVQQQGIFPNLTKTCQQLDAPVYGNITYSKISADKQVPVGTRAVLECPTGFEPLDSIHRSCEENGRWSGNATLACQDVNECAAIPSPCPAVATCANYPGKFACLR